MQEFCDEQSGKTLSIQNNISDIPIGIDYTFVSQVNNNLISNAIRYATSKVNITYTSNNDGFYLSVSDNGCGFSKNILSKATNHILRKKKITLSISDLGCTSVKFYANITVVI